MLARWRTLFREFGPAFDRFVLGLQVHGTRVARHREGGPGWRILDGIDGHVTREPGVLLCVTVADCIPIYLAHPASGAVGLLHAGWRGTAAGILRSGLDALCAVGGCRPADVVMHCGIGICGSCYEVGPEVREALTSERFEGPSTVDLRAILAAQATALGVGRVSVSGRCSAHDRDRFYSHRASRGTDGRMVAYVGRAVA